MRSAGKNKENTEQTEKKQTTVLAYSLNVVCKIIFNDRLINYD